MSSHGENKKKRFRRFRSGSRVHPENPANNDARMDLKEIRELAAKYSVAELDSLVEEMLRTEGDALQSDAERSELFNSLVKAETVRGLMDQGMSEGEAIRELGRRMRVALGSNGTG